MEPTIDFFSTVAKRVANQNYSKQSIQSGIEVLQCARHLFPDQQDQRRLDWEVGHLAMQIADFKTQVNILHQERRYQLWGAYAMKFDRPLWDGIPRTGDTILMVGEGGIGDELFAAKFSFNYYKLGMNVVFATNYHPSKSLLSRIAYIKEVIHIDDIPNQKYDYWIPAGESPIALNLNQEDVPNHQYFFPTLEHLEKWKEIIPESDKLKIGVRWSGCKQYETHAGTIIPFSFFDQLVSDDIEVYSLQRDDGVEEIAPNSKIIPLHDKLETWDDTLAAMEQLDLVISSSTSLPIVSAGLNKETWIVVPTFCYCLWVGEETTSHWFGDNFKVYRQSKFNEWEKPFEKVKRDLNERAVQKKLNRS